jgi:hypothetical protein
MTPRRRLLVASLLLALAAPAFAPARAPAFADDAPPAKTYDLAHKDRFAVGDVRTTTSKDRTQDHQTVSGQDGTVVQDTNREDSLEATFAMKVLEVDGQGHPVKARVRISKWQREVGGAKDASLEGAILDLSGWGEGQRRWELVTETTLTDDARAWVDRTFVENADGDARVDAFFPAPVAVGGTWKPDLAWVTGPKALGKRMTLDAEKATGTGSLESVEKDVASFVLVVEAPIRAAAGPQGTIQVTKGTAKLTLKGKSNLASALNDGSSHRVEQSIDLEFPVPGGTFPGVVHKVITATRESTYAAGGDVSDPKGPLPGSDPKGPEAPPPTGM